MLDCCYVKQVKNANFLLFERKWPSSFSVLKPSVSECIRVAMLTITFLVTRAGCRWRWPNGSDRWTCQENTEIKLGPWSLQMTSNALAPCQTAAPKTGQPGGVHVGPEAQYFPFFF